MSAGLWAFLAGLLPSEGVSMYAKLDARTGLVGASKGK